jgi:hypothetical protein
MNNQEKLEKMDKTLSLLEDLKNSQIALVEKVTQLQLEAMEYNFAEMEKNMAALYSRYQESLEILEKEIERFEIKRNKFESENKLG